MKSKNFKDIDDTRIYITEEEKKMNIFQMFIV